MASPAFVTLRREGVSVVLDVSDKQMPALVHWGADLGPLSFDDCSAIRVAGVPTIAPNQADVPVRLALVPESSAGWLGRPGLAGSRSGRAWTPEIRATSVRIDGQEWSGTHAELSGGSVEVTGTDASAGLSLAVTVELVAGGLLRSRAAVTNLTAEPYQVDHLHVALPIPTRAHELLDFAGRWGRERSPQRQPWNVGTHLRENRRGRTGADAATVLHAGTSGFSFAAGEVWGVHTAWSGNHVHLAERMNTGDQVLGGGELILPGEVVLGGGQTYTSPWLYGSFGVGLDEVARRFHRFLRARPGHPSADRPVTINVWEAVYFDHQLQPLLDLADLAASVGVERYVLDDGWFGARRDDGAGLGDWTVSPDMWPDGLHPLVDHVRGLGMQFGLWFEPEMVNPNSEVARAHPEWIMAADPSRWPIEARRQQVLNLAIPECFDHVLSAILAILDEYDIAYIKWDHNRDLIEAATQSTGRPGVHEQTLAFYRLVDAIKAAHPGLEIESCSSGGSRVDLEVLQRTERVWVSDCIDPHERQLMHRWTTQLIPPEMMGSHIASHRSHTTGRMHDLGFRAATAVFGHLGIEWDLRAASTSELAELAEWILFYKENRSLLNGGDLVRIDFPEPGFIGAGVVAPDRSRAVYSHALCDWPDAVSLGRITLPGLDPQRRYRVTPMIVGAAPSGLRPPLWWGLERDATNHIEELRQGSLPRLIGRDDQGVVLSGRALCEVGLMHGPTHPDQSVLLMAEAVD